MSNYPLGQWIADYYLAPIGEVFRTMLPLAPNSSGPSAIASRKQGHMALHQAGMRDLGAFPENSRRPTGEFRVLDCLAERDDHREESLRPQPRGPKHPAGWEWCEEMDCP